MWFPEREKEGDIGKILLSNCDSLAKESCRIWLRTHLWFGDVAELRHSLFCHLFSSFYHTQSKQPWCPGWMGQEKPGIEEVRKWSQKPEELLCDQAFFLGNK